MKIRFINYRKTFKGKYPLIGWLPKFEKFWFKNLWLLSWRGFAVEFDKRKDWIADMITGKNCNKIL